MSRRKSSRGRVLVNAKGRKNTKNINDYIERINNDSSLSALEKRAKIADLRVYVEDRAKHNRRLNGSRLTTTGFEGWEADTELERMFANVGMSAEEIAIEYDLDEAELLDPSNWNKGIFKGQYQFNFTYTGTIMEKL